MPMRVVRGVLRTFSAPAVRYPPDPRAVFILALCVVVGFPLIFADATPSTIAGKLDSWLVVAWGAMLSGGALVTLLGAMRQTPTGIAFEQIGSASLGVACLMYAAAIWAAVQWAGAVPIAIVLGFGLASIWRFGQLWAYMRGIERLAQESKGDR